MRTVSSHVFAGTFAELNNNMILNENFFHGKNSVRLILAKFRLSFNDSQKQRFFNCNMNQLQDRLSHPTRVRGLKPPCFFIAIWHILVAPHTGAWIETLLAWLYHRCSAVAPHTGAWIETSENHTSFAHRLSHPTRVRGLKQVW